MSTVPQDPIDLRAIRRSLAPPETGGWFMYLLPALLGLLARPRWPGAALALAGLAAFLMRVPLKQLKAGVRVRASRLLLGCGTALMAGGAALAFAAAGWRPFLPLLAALPAALYALGADLRKEGRDLPVELSALAFFCAFAAAIPMAGGAGWREGARLGLLAWLSLAPGFGAVRHQLAARRQAAAPGLPGRRWPMHGLMLGCLAGGLGLLAAGWAGPWWWALQVLLYGRAFAPLHRGPAWNLGVLEILADSASLILILRGL